MDLLQINAKTGNSSGDIDKIRIINKFSRGRQIPGKPVSQSQEYNWAKSRALWQSTGAVVPVQDTGTQRDDNNL